MKKALLVVFLFAAVLLTVAFLGLIQVAQELGPHSEEEVLALTRKSAALVEGVDAYVEQEGSLPEGLPVTVELEELKGCKGIYYERLGGEGEDPYYRISLGLGLHEALVYDSRGDYSDLRERGGFRTVEGWAYYCD